MYMELKCFTVCFEGLSTVLRKKKGSSLYTSYILGGRKYGLLFSTSVTESLVMLAKKIENIEYFTEQLAEITAKDSVVFNMKNTEKVLAMFYENTLIGIYNPRTNRALDINLEKICSFGQLINNVTLAEFINSN